MELTNPPLFPPPLAGFKLQRKRSFDELNVESAERDRYGRVSSDPRKTLAPLFSAWHPPSNCHFEYFRSAPSRAGADTAERSRERALTPPSPAFPSTTRSLETRSGSEDWLARTPSFSGRPRV